MMEDNNSNIPGLLLGEALSACIDSSISGPVFSNPRKALDQFPKTLMDINYFIFHHIARALPHEVKIGLILAADVSYQKFLKKSLVSVNEVQSFMESYVNLCSKSCTNDNETWWCSEAMTWLSENLIRSISHSQALKILNYLTQKMAWLKTNYSENSLAETDPAKLSIDYTANTCLRLYGFISQKLQETEIKNLADLEIPLLNLLSYPKIQLQSALVLSMMIKNWPCMALKIVSQIITHTTIAYAELEGLRTQFFSKETLNEYINNLLGYCNCLAALIKALPACNRGIPVEETEIAFNTVKNMVSGGEYQGDVIDEDKMFASELSDQEIDNAIRHAAWIIVEGLVNLGPDWVGGRLNFLFKLWKLPFGRKTCIFEQMPHSWIIGEVTHKKAASNAMLAFIKHNKQLLQPQVFKLITVYLSNAVQFLCPQKKSTQHRQFLEQNCNPGILTQLKKNVYKCLLYLPNTFISGKISIMLNPICSEVVNEKVNNIPMFYYYSYKKCTKSSPITKLIEKWLSAEDFYIIYNKPSHCLYSIDLIGSEAQYETWESGHVAPIFCKMVRYSLKMLSKLFTSSSLNLSNRQKIFQFLSQHLSGSLKAKDGPYKYNKVSVILLAVLGCLKKLSINRGIITDSSLMTSIRTMLASVETISYPLVKCLFAEGMVYLCKVMADPQHIPVFMKEIEHRILFSENNNPSIKSGIVMQVGSMYKHFDITLLEKNQDALGHIIQSISRDSSVGAWALHALYKAYSVHGNKVENIFKATFPLGYHHYLDDNKAEFKFGIGMMLLCEKHMVLNPNTSDIFFFRANMVWEDTWKSSAFSYKCALRILDKYPEIVANIISSAVSLFPDKESVVFITRCSEKYFSGLKLLDLFRYYDESIDKDLDNSLILIIKTVLKSDPESMNTLKNIILSTEKEQEEEVKGLSALNDRETTQQTFEYYSYKSKILAIDFFTNSVSSAPEKYEKNIEEYLNFAIHLYSFDGDLSIKGAVLAYKIYTVSTTKAYGNVVDNDDPTKKYLELFEAQVSAAIRQGMDCNNLYLCLATNKLLLKFLVVPGSHDASVISRLIKNLVESLFNRGKF